jgi:putative SOS response-associated peptidase YedK
MCGRYSLTQAKERIEKRFNSKITQTWKPRYNIAPSQVVPVITNKNTSEISFFKWGLIPSWSLNDNTGNNLINAKSETILTRSPFKQLIQSHRCLILADGFYEWKSIGKKKTPYRFTLNTDEAFAFAGIWDSWDNGDDVVNTFTIITTTANKLVSEVHDRMPVILPQNAEQEWLKNDLSDKQIVELLQPYDSERMCSYASHRAVNSPNTDSPECIQVAPRIYPGETFSLFD